ncbi:Metallo-hydrolase/oxidoreductase [Pyrenochaeta sp. DS3sAY3a]|nr:Metallo-hydrolase/oxidoreductase [Pyrenochaeta sp. DS3sAY3a]
MSPSHPLQLDTYVSQPIKTETGLEDETKQWWQPITTTLIHGPTSAVLVDPPITVTQSEVVADWVESILALYPGKILSYIYITHAHGDHFFGAPIIMKRFPQAELIATATVLEGIKVMYSTEVYDGVWTKWFPNGQLCGQKPMPTSLPPSNEFHVDGEIFKAHDVSSDCEKSSFLHIPSIATVVGGDVVYGDCHQHLGEASTAERRQKWFDALDLIDSLQPKTVVPSHKRASQSDGAHLVAATRMYMEDFVRWGEEVKMNDSIEVTKKPDALFARIKKGYPQRCNDWLLWGGVVAFFT